MNPTNPADRAGRIEELFQRACELAPSERAAFLDFECAGEDPIRRRVEQLLEASEAADGNPAWSLPALHNEAQCSADNAESPDAIERYRLLKRIGAGGMGAVYKAVRADDAYSKVVAVKIVHQYAAAEDLLRRFRTERQILAGLEHPNIARLLDGGSTPDGLPFLVMEYVDGVPIDEYVRRKRLSIREILTLFRTICEAVSYAHNHLVVHCDLKPANILVTESGESRLLDFGIAKLLGGTAARTVTNRALTPEYASPEQIRGEPVAMATDVYSLGVLLYQLLSGRQPYTETCSTMELARAICEEPPLPLRELDPEIDMILQMALRKEAARRYQSVEQFSGDIRRHLQGYPVLARPDTRAYRARKFLKRNRLAVVAGTAIVLTLICGIVATRIERDRAERERVRAQGAEVRSRHSLYAAQMSLAFQAWEAGNAGRTLDLLEGQRPKDGREDLRGFEWFLLWQLAHDASRTLSGPAELTLSAVFSPDGTKVVATTEAGKARLWDVPSGRMERDFNLSWPCNAAFSPDGKLVAGATNDGSVALWRADSGEMAAKWPGPGGPVWWVAISPDGRRLAAGSRDGTAAVYRLGSNTPPVMLRGHQGPVTSGAFSPDGSIIATTSHDHTAKLWNSSTGKEIGTLAGHSWWVLTAAFSPDGNTLATSGSDGVIKIWDVARRREVASIPGDGTTINHVSFSPDGKHLAVAGEDSLVRIFDAASRRLTSVLRGHTDGVKWVGFAPDGGRLVTAAYDRTVRIWDLAKPNGSIVLEGHRDWVWALQFSPDGQTLASAGKDGTIRLWNWRERRELTVLSHPEWVNGVAFSGNGRWLASADDDGLVRLWNAQEGTLAGVLRGHTSVVESVAFSPDSRTLASASKNGEIKLWDPVARKETATLDSGNHNLIWSVCFSPDGRYLAAAEGATDAFQLGPDYGVVIWELATRKIVTTLRGHTFDVRAIAFSPTGNTLASGSFDGTIRLWNVKSGRAQRVLYTHKVNSLAFSADGTRLASAGADKTVRLWDVDTLQEVGSLTVPSQVNSLGFSPDNRALAVGSNDGKVRLWLADPMK